MQTEMDAEELFKAALDAENNGRQEEALVFLQKAEMLDWEAEKRAEQEADEMLAAADEQGE